MKTLSFRPFAALSAITFFVLMSIYSCGTGSGVSEQDKIKRGEYLVTTVGCGDCHSPKVMTEQGPQEDRMRLLSGHPAAEVPPEIPSEVLSPTGWVAVTNGHLTAWGGPWGISYATNLTPDDLTGIGAWTEDAFIKAMRNGKHLGTGRPILPPMPWANLSKMTDEDLGSIFTYLKSIRPVRNQVPQPIPPKG